VPGSSSSQGIRCVQAAMNAANMYATARSNVKIAALQYRRKLMSQNDLNLHHLGHSIRSMASVA
jgi:hypothetical protein